MRYKVGDNETIDKDIIAMLTSFLAGDIKTTIQTIFYSYSASNELYYIGDWDNSTKMGNYYKNLMTHKRLALEQRISQYDIQTALADFTKTRSLTTTKTGTEEVEKTGTVTNKNMAEEAPIGATATYDITTPSAKGNSESENDLDDTTTFHTTVTETILSPDDERLAIEFQTKFPSLYQILFETYMTIFEEWRRIY